MKIVCFFLILIINNTAIAQNRMGVNIHTGEKVSCKEYNCDDADSSFKEANKFCLNCKLYEVDSIMNSQINSILKSCATKQWCRDFTNKQTKWEKKRQILSIREGNQYKGGIMEITEYLRKKILLTIERIKYLRSFRLMNNT